MQLCGGDHGKLVARINRIEGQVRGIKKMVEENRECMQILKQIAATGGALRSLGAVILEEHLKVCVTDAIRERADSSDLIEQVVDMFKKFSK